MAISDEEASKIKEHLLKQLSNFPEEKQKQIQEQVNSMTTPQIEEFVQQNQLTHLGGQCIFCSIISGQTSSFPIAENGGNIAILEINPLSRGHTLVVPKEHNLELGDSTKALAIEVAKILKKKLQPKEVITNELKIMDHAIMEVIPIYGGEKERHPATQEELRGVREEILKKEITPPKKIEPEEILPTVRKEVYKMPPRIP